MAQHIFTCFWIQDFLWRIEIIDWFARQCQGVRYTSILSFVELFSLQVSSKQTTLWYQLENIFQLIVTAQGIEKVTIQLIDTPTKVYAIGARLFLSKVPLEVLQNWVLIQLIVTPHILGKVKGQIKEVCQLIEPCLLIGTREYVIGHLDC